MEAVFGVLCAVKLLGLSADFAEASENGGKNLCCLLKIDITSVIYASENERNIPAGDMQLLFFLAMRFMMICHY